MALFSDGHAGQSIDAQELRYVGTGWNAEGLYVFTVANISSTDGCGPKYRIDANHPMLKIMTAELLSAFYAGARVNLYVDGCIAPDLMNLKSVAVVK